MGTGQVAGNHTSVNNRDCWVGKEKHEPLDGQETTHLGVTRVLEADKKRWEKVGISCI